MGWITNERRLAIYLRDGFVCQWCLLDLHSAPAAAISLDHIIPRSKGGTNSSWNLITSCHHCNSVRQDKDHKKFARKNDQAAIRRINSQRRKNINLSLAKSIIAGRTPKHEARAA